METNAKEWGEISWVDGRDTSVTITRQIEFGAEISEHGLPYLTFTYECD